jgi:hypothetical protein
MKCSNLKITFSQEGTEVMYGDAHHSAKTYHQISQLFPVLNLVNNI